MEEPIFIVQDVDFWNILLSDSSWALIGIIIYFSIVYRHFLIKENPFKVFWRNRNLILYSYFLTSLIAIVYQSFPAIVDYMQQMPFYSDTLGKVGFVGVGGVAMRYAQGPNKDKLKNDIFEKITGIDPNKPLK